MKINQCKKLCSIRQKKNKTKNETKNEKNQSNYVITT